MYYRVLASTNYKAVAAQTIKVRIERKEVEIPAEEGRSFTYNGEAQTYAIAANEAYTVSGNVQTGAVRK